MTATEILRRLLDERGVEWQGQEDVHTDFTFWCGVHACETGPMPSLAVYHLTPAQAIAATLGAGTCHVECFDDGIDEALDGSPIYTTPTWYLSCGHTCEGAERPSFCKNCGRKVVDA